MNREEESGENRASVKMNYFLQKGERNNQIPMIQSRPS